MKTITLFYFICLCSSMTMYGWIVTLKVMTHSDGHIVRLAGDLIHTEFLNDSHATYRTQDLDRSATNAITEPLVKFLNTSDSTKERVLVEKRSVNKLDSIKYWGKALSDPDPAAITLIFRLGILADSSLDSSFRSKAAHIGSYLLDPTIEITEYDIRNKYPQLYYHLNFPVDKDKYDLFCHELRENKDSFRTDIQNLLATSDEYDPKFKSFMEKHAQAITRRLHYPSTLEDFFRYRFADFGYLDFIARHTDKNVTLFVGIAHCVGVAYYLESIGYETIFEAGSYDAQDLQCRFLPNPLEREAYQKFFTIADFIYPGCKQPVFLTDEDIGYDIPKLRFR